MKTLIQKIHLDPGQSFACRTYRTPAFETNWHKHEEHELILIKEGNGTAMIGDFVGEYKPGDVYFLAGNLPHWFRKNNQQRVGAALVLHFHTSIFGDNFLTQPELKSIAAMLNRNNGIQLLKAQRTQAANNIILLEKSSGFERMSLLLECLQQISVSRNYLLLTENFSDAAHAINPAIEKIIDYSFRHYLEPITLTEVAKIAGMSIPTFCRFFKKNIKKTYFEFLQDLRISHACKLLTSTNKPVAEICYESGYNSWAHFSKQFKMIKQTTPLKYRKEFEIVT
jgi:AraC-like DNA-binding protein